MRIPSWTLTCVCLPRLGKCFEPFLPESNEQAAPESLWEKSSNDRKRNGSAAVDGVQTEKAF
jgi:hypothetical protein